MLVQTVAKSNFIRARNYAIVGRQSPEHYPYTTGDQLTTSSQLGCEKFWRMLGGVGGRHASVRRRGSSPGVRRYAAGAAAADDSPPASPRPMRRRRAALAAQDHKTCALIHTRLKLGDIM
ncbi:hypothetical protein SFRURICE_004710 [Spodoptera frugiperda]|uniref:SFRICE_035844 n=1 Tax=Spodoptera frugiperda TaxID=7108 RepID=A0A2H1WYQ9_SPOFR|nr:hypothetical protein SFRURICE_004710 [Spodoptera frugiperda]